MSIEDKFFIIESILSTAKLYPCAPTGWSNWEVFPNNKIFPNLTLSALDVFNLYWLTYFILVIFLAKNLKDLSMKSLFGLKLEFTMCCEKLLLILIV